jgi:glucose/arabinose dehydrogenase
VLLHLTTHFVARCAHAVTSLAYPAGMKKQTMTWWTGPANWAGGSLLAAAMMTACGGSGGSGGNIGETGSQSGLPGGLKVSEVATGLTNAWSVAFLPDRQMLITLRAGTLLLMSANGATRNAIAGVPAVDTNGQGGLLDVALDPNYATNRRIYLSYAERDAAGNNGTAVARAELDATSRTLVNLTVIYQQLPKVAGSNGHFGSRLVFDASGYLWVALGDRQIDSQRGFAQDLARGNGKVVRINTAGAAAPNPGRQCPAGNLELRPPQYSGRGTPPDNLRAVDE